MVNEAPKRGRGRPPAPELERRGENLTLRVRAETKAALERHAAQTGRSLSSEAEAWLREGLLSEGLIDQALDLAFGHQTAGIILLLGRVIRHIASTGDSTTLHAIDEGKSWLSSPYLFDQVVQALETVMERLRPDGEIERSPWGAGDLATVARDALGVATGDMLLGAVANVGLSADLIGWGAQIRARLDPEIIERIKERRAMAPTSGDRHG
jgi:hypothetical protein